MLGQVPDAAELHPGTAAGKGGRVGRRMRECDRFLMRQSCRQGGGQQGGQGGGMRAGGAGGGNEGVFNWMRKVSGKCEANPGKP